MKPGFYILTRNVILAASDGPYRTRLPKGSWLVTDGQVLGVFDKENVLDWVPLEWVRGKFIPLEGDVEARIITSSVQVPFSKLEHAWKVMMTVEPGEVVPELPKPPLTTLAPYLRARRTLLAHTYDHR